MRSPSRRTTIKDIARATDTSVATVSRVLSNSGYPVSRELRKKILRTAEGLDYRPNIFSRILRGGVNTIIGVIVPSIANPFYSQLASNMETFCIAAGYAPIICSSRNNPLLEQNHLETLKRQQVAGLLLSTINGNSALFRKLGRWNMPCVLFDQPGEHAGDSVVFDFRRGGEMATRHLIDNGHSRIAFASPNMDRGSRRLIFEGYKDALRAGGMRLNRERVVLLDGQGGRDSLEAGDYECGTRLAGRIMGMRRFPDAVVAVNDITAVGILSALSAGGVQVPADISIVGFDDIEFSSMVTPALTTIRQSAMQTAELATRALFRRIDRPGGAPVREVVEPELVERRSVRTLHPGMRKQS